MTTESSPAKYKDTLPPAEEARIRDLYDRRRHGLTSAENEELCKLAMKVLQGTKLPGRYADPDSRRDLIIDFIADAILCNAQTTKAGPLKNAFALRTFLKRYAVNRSVDARSDEIRSGGRVQLGYDDNGRQTTNRGSSESSAANSDPEVHESDLASLDGDNEDNALDRDCTPFAEDDLNQAGTPATPTPAAPRTSQRRLTANFEHNDLQATEAHPENQISLERKLEQMGTDIGRVHRAALQLLAQLDAFERACLAYNTCADAEDEQAMTDIRARLGINSGYHYRAKKLGITGAKDGFYRGYESTTLGTWFIAMGATISRDHYEDQILPLMQILCLHAQRSPEVPL